MELPKNRAEHLANVLRGMGYVCISATVADQVIDHSDYTIREVLDACAYMNEQHIERGQE